MTLFHGTTNPPFDSFKTPTGLEKMDVTRGGVVYLTDQAEVASKYAGETGWVAEVQVENPVTYAEQRRLQGLGPKAKKYTRGVYVALPREVTIVRWHQSRELSGKSRKGK